MTSMGGAAPGKVWSLLIAEEPRVRGRTGEAAGPGRWASAVAGTDTRGRLLGANGLGEKDRAYGDDVRLERCNVT